MNSEHAPIADHAGLMRWQQKQIRQYGILLGVGGGINAIMAALFSQVGYPVALGVAIVGTLALLIVMVVWGSQNRQALRVSGAASRLFWITSALNWLLSTVAFFLSVANWIWWITAAGMIIIGVASWWQAQQSAKELESQLPQW